MTEQKQVFEFPANAEPVWVAVDAERVILCERKEEQTQREWVNQYKLSKLFQDRYDALGELKPKQNSNVDAKAVFEQALNDPFWVLRNVAIDEIKIDPVKDAGIIQKIEKLALNDARSDVRAAAIERLGAFRDKKYLSTFQNVFNNDKSYRVLNSTLLSIEKIDSKAAREIAKNIEKETDNTTLLLAIAELYTKGADKSLSSFYENNYLKMGDYSGITFFEHYSDFLIEVNDMDLIGQKIDFLKTVGSNQQISQWIRYGATNALKKLQTNYAGKPLESKISSAIKEVISKETNSMLQNIYSNW
jgi:aminopeptidase N